MVVPPAAAEAETPSFFNRLKSGLRNTGAKLSGLLTGRRIDEALFEELEDALISADTGVDTAAGTPGPTPKQSSQSPARFPTRTVGYGDGSSGHGTKPWTEPR